MKHFAAFLILALTACAPPAGVVNRQMIGLLEKFDRWDYNGDGQLVLSELQEAEESSGFPAEDILKFYDTGKNGRISHTEVEAGVSRLDEARVVVNQMKERL
jgi:hypothetical protein